MAEGPRWAYVRARVRARHGDRPDAKAWRALEASTDAAAFILAARELSVGWWLAGIEADLPAPAVEGALRRAWVQLVREVAEWPPAPWSGAVRWLECLPFLELVEHLFEGAPRADRWTEDPVLGSVARADPSQRGDALEALGWGALRPLDREPIPWLPIASRWRRELGARVPARDTAGAAAVEALVGRIARHREALRRTPGPHGLESRRDLERHLRDGLARGGGGAGELFHHLALEAFDAQRLRAGLLVRLELPGVEAGRTWV